MNDDETAFFTRPKKRSFHGEVVANVVAIDSSASDTDEDRSDSDESCTKSPQAKDGNAKGQPRKKLAEPKLAPTGSAAQPLSLSSDEDETDQKRGTKTSGSSRVKTNAHVTRRSRSRSGSLTPPPQLTPRRRLAGTQLIQNTFRSYQEELYPTRTMPTTINDTELSFEEQQRQKTLETQDEPEALPVAPLPPEDDSIIEIVVRGIFVDLPSPTQVIPDVKSWETPRILRMRLNMKLAIAKTGFCKEAGLCTIVGGQKVVDATNEKRISGIVLSYRGVRVFDYVTPQGLGIAPGEQPYFEAYTKESWTCILQNPELRQKQHQIGRESGKGSGTADSPSTPPTEKYVKVTLRAKDGRELKVRTLPSTKISAIIAGFKKTHGITQEVALYLEGEMLEGTVGMTDIESDDVIDVRIAS